MAARTRTFSQAPQAVRSARSLGREFSFPAGTRADRALGSDKRDPLGLTVHVHRFRNISRAAAIRAVVRTQTSPPSSVVRIFTRLRANCSKGVFYVTNHEQESRKPPFMGRLTSLLKNSREPPRGLKPCQKRKTSSQR